MNKRINITLPAETIQLIDQVTAKGGRSRLIDHAVKHYVDSLSRRRLRRELEQGAVAQAERDLKLAEDWFPLDEEAWASEKGNTAQAW